MEVELGAQQASEACCPWLQGWEVVGRLQVPISNPRTLSVPERSLPCDGSMTQLCLGDAALPSQEGEVGRVSSAYWASHRSNGLAPSGPLDPVRAQEPRNRPGHLTNQLEPRLATSLACTALPQPWDPERHTIQRLDTPQGKHCRGDGAYTGQCRGFQA